LYIEKIVVVAPIPSAREMIVMRVTEGAFRRIRRANLRFVIKPVFPRREL
jgi:hypothetical protein